MERDFSEFDFTVKETCALSEQERGELRRLFERNYRQANPAFLEKSLAALRHAALAYHDGVAVGFGVAEARVMDLPRLPDQVVNLMGLSCVAPGFRRRGLFLKLELLALAADAVPQRARRLTCGRIAHPAVMRSMAQFPSCVPRPGVQPSAWQQEVGSAIAEAYGVRDFDPETFVCIGSGTPTGYPRIEVDVEPHEWEIFKPVDRDRGDALLGIAWIPDPPRDW